MNQRRHHLTTALEIQYVKEAIRTRLMELLEGRTNETEATVLFQVWWRLENPRQGQPAYPPFSWSSLRAYINPMMVPLGNVMDCEIMNPIQRLELFLTGKVFVGHRTRPGWNGSLPFYKFKCPKHGIVEDYPHGFNDCLDCPECFKEESPSRGEN